MKSISKFAVCRCLAPLCNRWADSLINSCRLDRLDLTRSLAIFPRSNVICLELYALKIKIEIVLFLIKIKHRTFSSKWVDNCRIKVSYLDWDAFSSLHTYHTTTMIKLMPWINATFILKIKIMGAKQGHQEHMQHSIDFATSIT